MDIKRLGVGQSLLEGQHSSTKCPSTPFLSCRAKPLLLSVISRCLAAINLRVALIPQPVISSGD